MAETNSNADNSVANVRDPNAFANALLGDDVMKRLQDEDDNLDNDLPITPDSNLDDDDDDDSLPTWHEMLGVDQNNIALDEQGNLKGIITKIDGKVQEVPVKDLIAGYQTNQYVTQKSQALAAEKQQFEQLRQQAAQQYQLKLDSAQKLTEVIASNFIKEYQGINWDELRRTNPAEYAATFQDYQLKGQQLKNTLTAIEQERQLEHQNMMQEQSHLMQRYLAEQANLVIQKNPEWTDPVKLKTALNEMHDFATTTYGFSTQEFQSLGDARYMEVLKDALAYRKGLQSANGKLNNVQQFQQSNRTSQRKPMSKLEKYAQAAKKATGHAKRGLETAAVAELLMNGDGTERPRNRRGQFI